MTAAVATPAAAEVRTELLDVRDVEIQFAITRGIVLRRKVGAVRAVDGVSLALRRGETLALVGESGSGKTTLGRAIVRLFKPAGGQILFDGLDIARLKGDQLDAFRRRVQMVYQDPYASLDARMSIGRTLEEPLAIHRIGSRAERQARVASLTARVGLDPESLVSRPSAFSGGQRQRIGIARALMLNPELLVLDEPTSSLDVSIQAQVINLLADLQGEFGLTYLFISHDLSVVRHVADRVAVMYAGKIVELADRDDLYAQPLHPYTKTLLSAVPIPSPAAERSRQRLIAAGDLPDPAAPPPGCRFHTRCPFAQRRCAEVEPVLAPAGGQRSVACHYWEELRES